MGLPDCMATLVSVLGATSVAFCTVNVNSLYSQKPHRSSFSPWTLRNAVCTLWRLLSRDTPHHHFDLHFFTY